LGVAAATQLLWSAVAEAAALQFVAKDTRGQDARAPLRSLSVEHGI
jgi:hypothetical protein